MGRKKVGEKEIEDVKERRGEDEVRLKEGETINIVDEDIGTVACLSFPGMYTQNLHSFPIKAPPILRKENE